MCKQSWILLIFTFAFSSSCLGQKKGLQSKSSFSDEHVNESTWVPRKTEESYSLKVADTTLNEINLIFERSFNDSIKIFVDSFESFSKTIRTLKNQSVVDEEFKISYSNDDLPLVSLYLIEKKKKISFKPPRGYILAYLSRQDGIWSIEFSNYQRVYY